MINKKVQILHVFPFYPPKMPQTSVSIYFGVLKQLPKKKIISTLPQKNFPFFCKHKVIAELIRLYFSVDIFTAPAVVLNYYFASWDTKNPKQF